MNTYLVRARDYWAQRNPRERLVLAGGTVIVAIALLYGFLLAPVQQERSRLAEALPALKANAARFARDLAQASGKTQSANMPELPGLAAAAGLPAEAIQMNPPSRAMLHAQGVSWHAVTRLLADAQLRGWQLKSLQVKAADGGTAVNVDAEWRQ